MVLDLHHYVVGTLHAHQADDRPPQGLLGVARVILHEVCETREQHTDDQDTGLVHELYPILKGALERSPDPDVQELKERHDLEKHDLKHWVSRHVERR